MENFTTVQARRHILHRTDPQVHLVLLHDIAATRKEKLFVQNLAGLPAGPVRVLDQGKKRARGLQLLQGAPYAKADG